MLWSLAHFVPRNATVFISTSFIDMAALVRFSLLEVSSPGVDTRLCL